MISIKIWYFFFQEATIPSAESLNIIDFNFSDFGLPEDMTTQATIRMFLDLKLVQEFNIDYKVIGQRCDYTTTVMGAAVLLNKKCIWAWYYVINDVISLEQQNNSVIFRPKLHEIT